METTPLLSSSPHLRVRARAELERRRRGLTSAPALARYQFDPYAYITENLHWEPWRGSPDAPGQAEILDAYALALRRQHARRDAAPGDDQAEQIRHIIRVEAGHGVGKTTLAAGMVNHFFDCFAPSIVYCFAPTYEQIHDLLFKEIKQQRRSTGLPGRILDLGLQLSDAHFVKGRATNNAGGQGTERAQGQHGPYLMFVIDEAEGVADFVFDAIKSMSSGGIVMVVMLANPRTRTSRFHRLASGTNVANFRLSCLHHPNVLSGRPLIPGAVERTYVESMIDDGEAQHCEVVAAHDPDAYTFELSWRPGVIYRPDAEFLFRVLGIAPTGMTVNTFCPVGRFGAARHRVADPDTPHVARIGVDVARWGNDTGTIYIRHNGRVWRAAALTRMDTTVYAQAIKQAALPLAAQGVTSLHIRVDGGGGFGGGVVDQVRRDMELRRAFADFQVLEINNNSVPHDPKAFADLGTEMYWHTAEALKVLALDRSPAALERDLCERVYDWVKVHGQDVRRLESKREFKKRNDGRSPDDGDGCVLACAPDYLFVRPARAVAGGQRPQVEGYRVR
jgi:hypothetical protein